MLRRAPLAAFGPQGLEHCYFHLGGIYGPLSIVYTGLESTLLKPGWYIEQVPPPV